MAWPQRTVNDISEFASFFRTLRPDRTERGYLCRGQPDARPEWKLTPSLTRLVRPPGAGRCLAHGIEKRALSTFIQQAGMHMRHMPELGKGSALH